MRRLRFSALATAAQVIVSSGVYFVLYRVLVSRIGLEMLVAWSFVSSMTAVASIGGFGFAPAITKFLAASRVDGSSKDAANLLRTAIISVSVSSGILLVVAVPIFYAAMPSVVGRGSLAAGRRLLPIMSISAWIALLGTVMQGALDGLQHFVTRSVLNAGGLLMFLIAAAIATARWGVIGLAGAQLMYVTVMFIAGAAAVVVVGGMQLMRGTFSRVALRRLAGYGAGLQAANLASATFDPVTKALIGHFAGPATIAVYEMAARYVTQLRSVFVGAVQVLVPSVAAASLSGQPINYFYRKAADLSFGVAVPLYGVVVLGSFPLAAFWFGKQNSQFTLFAALLAVGWCASTIAAPAYFCFLGNGRLKWPAITQWIIAIMNGLVGGLMGYLGGAYGVVLAWCGSLVIASIVLISKFHSENPYVATVSKADTLITIGVALVTGTLLGGLMWAPQFSWFYWAAACATYVLCITPYVLRHPLAGDLVATFRRQAVM